MKVLVLRRACELIRMRQERRKPYKISINQERCTGEKCSFCVKYFACPGLTIGKESRKAQVVAEVCVGCGVCAEICPNSAIVKVKESKEDQTVEPAFGPVESQEDQETCK